MGWLLGGTEDMTKADIIENVYEKVGGFSKKEAAEIVETVFDTIKETLERGEKIKISGFGNFVVRDKNSRVGRNPQTGKETVALKDFQPQGGSPLVYSADGKYVGLAGAALRRLISATSNPAAISNTLKACPR